MKKLLNTLYITQEDAYLALDGETIVCRIQNEERFKIPFDNVENIVCFSYIGCSPALTSTSQSGNASPSFSPSACAFSSDISFP